jgi:alcohol dehydrogenase
MAGNTSPGRSGSGAPFRFAYEPAAIRYGTGCVDDLGAELAAADAERALVVCGSTVGETPAVVDPVTEGLGDRLAGVFAETTPEKRLATAVEGLAAMEAADADALVGLGGGSSLDVTKVIAALAVGDRDPAAVGRELAETGRVSVPEGSPPPILVVPTTLAGADLSLGGGVTAGPDSGPIEEPTSGGVSDPRLMPRAAVYDPALFATTPERALAGSAMNGFDKGVETLYAREATPVTDATATEGLSRLGRGLRDLGREGPDAETLEPVVEGLVLVQYGVSRPEGSTLSLIHAFGHGLTDAYDIQQGVAHAVVAPHALRFLFERVDGRRDRLAAALGAAGAADPAAAVVEEVAAVRDALGLPARLRDVSGIEVDPEDFPAVAETVLADSLLANAPPDLDPTAADLAGVLRAAY